MATNKKKQTNWTGYSGAQIDPKNEGKDTSTGSGWTYDSSKVETKESFAPIWNDYNEQYRARSRYEAAQKAAFEEAQRMHEEALRKSADDLATGRWLGNPEYARRRVPSMLDYSNPRKNQIGEDTYNLFKAYNEEAKNNENILLSDRARRQSDAKLNALRNQIGITDEDAFNNINGYVNQIATKDNWKDAKAERVKENVTKLTSQQADWIQQLRNPDPAYTNVQGLRTALVQSGINEKDIDGLVKNADLTDTRIDGNITRTPQQELEYQSSIVDQYSPADKADMLKYLNSKDAADSMQYTAKYGGPSAKMAMNARSESDSIRSAIMKRNNMTEEQFAEFENAANVIRNYNFTQGLRNDTAASVNTGNAVRDTAMSAALTASGWFMNVGAAPMAVTESFKKRDADSPVDTNSRNYALTNMNTAATQAIEQRILGDEENPSLARRAGKVAYDVVNATGQSLTAAALGGQVVGVLGLTGSAASAVANMVTLPGFGMSSYATTLQEAQERGLTRQQAMMTATVAGVAEMATEIFSLDHFWEIVQKSGSAAGKSVLLNTLAQAGIEGSEEVASDIINNVYDIMANADKSQYAIAVQRYIDAGDNPETAKKKATMDLIKDAAVSFAMGAASGGITGGAANVANRMLTNSQAKDFFRDNDYAAIAEGIDTTRDNFDSQEAYDKAVQVANLAKSYADRQTNGEAISTADKRELYELVMEVTGKEMEARAESDRAVLPEFTEESVPEEFQDVQESTTIGDAIGRMSTATTAEELEDARRTIEGAYKSSDAMARQIAENAYNQNAGRLLAAGVTQEELDQAKNRETRSSAYLAGLNGVDESAVSLNDDTRIAYNAGAQQRIKEAAAQSVSKDSDISGIKIDSIGDEGIISVKGKKVSVGQYQNEDAGVMSLVLNAAAQESTEAANAYLQYYSKGTPIKSYTAAFNKFYDIGASGAEIFEEIMSSNGWYKESLGVDTLKGIYEAGAKENEAHNRQTGTTTVRRGTGKVIDESTDKSKTAPYMPLFEFVARAQEIDLVLGEDAEEIVNGAFQKSASRVFLNVNNENMLQTFFHEVVGEFTLAWNPEGMKEVQEAIVRYTIGNGREGDVSETIRKYQHAYASFEGGKSFREAMDEYTNDALGGIMSSEGNMKQFLGWLKESMPEKAQGIIEKLKEWMGKALEAMQKMLANSSKMEPGMKDALRLNIAEKQKVMNLLEKAFKGAIENYRNATTIDEAIAEHTIEEASMDGSMKFSIATWNKGGKAALKAFLETSSELSEEDQQDILDSMERGYEIASQFAKRKDLGTFSRWSEAELTHGADGIPLVRTINPATGRPVQSVVVQNGEYPLNIDFSQVCKKRMTLNTVLNQLIKDYGLNLRTLTDTQLDDINRMIKQHGFEIACGLCFVDAKRYRTGAWANTFTDGKYYQSGASKGKQKSKGYNDLVRSLIPKGSDIVADYYNYATDIPAAEGRKLSEIPDSELDWKTIDRILQKYMKEDGTIGSYVGKNGKRNNPTEVVKMAYAIKNHPELRHILAEQDMIASEGLDRIRKENPELYSLINSHWGAGKPKLSHGATPYGNEIIESASWGAKNNFSPENAYAVGGIRVQSFSDYTANMFFDYMQMFADMAARQLPSHAYTKEASYVRIFGMTGQKINMSIVPKAAELTAEQQKRYGQLLKKGKKYLEADPEMQEIREHAGLKKDENGEWQYIIEDETFPLEEALEIQSDPRYAANCGIIWVGVSDEHIRKMLDDENVPMIIPYHSSGVSNLIKKRRNIDLYKDYTKEQNTRKKSDGSKITGKDFNWYESLNRTNDAITSANEYKQWCEDNGYLPKFAQFAGHPNYYKLLIDFRAYDYNGIEEGHERNFLKQGAVTATYPEEMSDLVLQSLKEQQKNDSKLESELNYEQGSLLSDIREVLNSTRTEEEGKLDEAKRKKTEKAAREGIKHSVTIDGGKVDRLSDIFDEQSFAMLESLVHNDPKTKYKQSNDTGEYVVFVRNHIVHTDFDFSNPKVSRVISFGATTGEVVANVWQDYNNMLKEGNSDDEILETVYAFAREAVVYYFDNSKRGNNKRYNGRGVWKEERQDNVNAGKEYERGAVYRGTGEVQDRAWHRSGEDYSEKKKEERVTISATISGNTVHLKGDGGDIGSLSRWFFGKAINKPKREKLLNGEDVSLTSKEYDKLIELIERKYSISVDNTGKELTDAQKEFFGDSKAVDEKGRLMVLYHGSPTRGITTFRTSNKWGYGGLYLSRYDDVSDVFAGSGGEVYKLYANLQNPLIVDAENRMYDSIPKTNLPKEVADHISSNYAETNEIVAILRDHTDHDGLIVRNVREANAITDDVIAFSPNQVKSINNENPTDSDDIRYSISLSDEEMDLFTGESNTEVKVDENGYLTMENLTERSMDRAVKILEEDTSIIATTKVDSKRIQDVASKLIAEYGSDYDMKEFANNIAKVFSYANKNQGRLDYHDFLSIMTDIAKPMIEQCRTDITDARAYKEFKDRLKSMRIMLSDQQKKEIKSAYGSIAMFRNITKGAITIVSSNGITLDEAWSSIADAASGWLDYDLPDTDQPIALADAIRGMRPAKANQWGANETDLAYDAALTIVERYYFDRPNPALRAKAEKVMGGIQELKKEYRQNVKKNYEERYQRKLAELEQKEADLKRKYGNKKEAIAKATAAQRNSLFDQKTQIKRVEEMKRIAEKSKSIIKMLEQPSDNRHVTDSFKFAVLDFMKSLDLVGTRTNSKSFWEDKMLRLSKVLNNMTAADVEGNATSISLIIDPDLAPMVSSFVDVNGKINHVSEMSLDQLTNLKKIVNSLHHAILKESSMYVNKYFQTTDAVASSTVQSLRKQRNDKARSKAGRVMHDMLSLDMADIFTWGEMLGEGAESIVQELRDGFDTRVWHLKEAMDYCEKELKGVDISSWTGDDAKVKTFTLESGQKIDLTIGQVMSLYKLNGRHQALMHIAHGGIKADTVKIKGKYKEQGRPVNVTDKDISNILNSLTPQQRDVADKLQRFMASECAKWGNHTSTTMYGYSKFTEKDYFPIKVDSNTIAANDSNIADNASLSALKNMSASKAITPNARNAVLISDIFDVFTKHVDDMAAYDGFVMPVADAMRWYNYKTVERGKSLDQASNDSERFDKTVSVQEEIGRVYGAGMKTWYINMMKSINGISQSGYQMKLTDKLISNYKGAAVGANLRVVIQQPTAYLRAMAEINPKYLAMATPSALQAKKYADKARANSAIALWKSWGFFETSIGPSMKAMLTGQQTKLEWIREKSTALAGVADDMTWGVLWKAVELEQADKFKKAGKSTTGKDFMQAVTERFNYIVDRTQVVDSTLHRTQYMRNTDRLAKLQTAFMAEPSKSWNMLLRGYNDMIRSGDKLTDRSYRKFTRVMTAYVLTNILTAAAAAIMDAFRDKDEEEWMDKWMDAFKGNILDNINPLNLLPIAKDAVSAFQATFMDGYQQSTRMDIDGITNLVSSMGEIYKYINGESNKTYYGLAKNFMKSFSQVSGIPVYGAMREVETWYDAIRSQFEDLPDAFRSSQPTSKEIRRTTYHDLYSAIEKNESTSEAIGNLLLNEGVTLKDIESSIGTEYRNTYKEADEDTKELMKSQLVPALINLNHTEEDAIAIVEGWDDSEVGYKDIDAAIKSGEGIKEAMDALKVEKTDDNILDHMTKTFGEDLYYRAENYPESLAAAEGGVKDALVAYGMTADSAAKQVKDWENGKIASVLYPKLWEAIDNDQDFKATMADLIELKGGDTVRSKLTSMYKQEMIDLYANNKSAYNDLKSTLVEAYTLAGKEKDDAEKLVAAWAEPKAQVTKYEGLYTSIEKGGNIGVEMQGLIDAGKKPKDIKTQLTKRYRLDYCESYEKNRKHYYDLQAKLKAAYMSMGMSSDEAFNELQEWWNWYNKNKGKK